VKEPSDSPSVTNGCAQYDAVVKNLSAAVNRSFNDQNHYDLKTGDRMIKRQWRHFNPQLKFWYDQMVTCYVRPHLEAHVYKSLPGAGKPAFLEPLISRNLHGSTRRSLDWHYDGINELVKVLLYLTDVDERSGCFTAFLHTESSVPLRIRPAVTLEYLNPNDLPNIHPEWVAELIEHSFRPWCATGPAGTMVTFDTSIIHWASRLEEGHIRDTINFQIKVPRTRIS